MITQRSGSTPQSDGQANQASPFPRLAEERRGPEVRIAVSDGASFALTKDERADGGFELAVKTTNASWMIVEVNQ